MNSLKKALASLFVLATIFVVFSCSNASDSNEKSDGNPFKGTKWEGGGMTLEFISSDTCIYGSDVSAFSERAAMSSGTEYSYTWKENDDGSYTAILKIEDYDTGMTFTIDPSDPTNIRGTFTIDGYDYEFGKMDDGGKDDDSGDNAVRYPFVDTEWVYEDHEEATLSFGTKYVAMNGDEDESFYYVVKHNGKTYTAELMLDRSGGFVYATFKIESAEADKGVFAFTNMSSDDGVTYIKK